MSAPVLEGPAAPPVHPGGWEVVVVGAGPAGAAVAARLAALGRRVLVVDRSEFPRRKPCGDCINPAAVRALESLGALGRVLEQPHAELRGWRVRPGDGEPFEGRFPPGEIGLGMARERLDAALVEHARAAGADVVTALKVRDLLLDRGAVVGIRGTRGGRGMEIEAPLVIGADGLRSVVSRRLGLVRRAPRLRKLALTARVGGLETCHGLGELRVRSWGCTGIAPIGGGLVNVTVVVSGDAVAGVAGRRTEHFDQVLAAAPDLRGVSREGDVIATGPFDCPVRSAVHDGALLVGDAAGYFDPFTGQGIYRALRGAELAAAAAEAAIAEGDFTARALRSHERSLRREFGTGERLQRGIEAVVSRPRLLAAAVAALRRRPALADTLIGVTGDLLPLRALASPRLFHA
jgi:flavin-dependent dehydrogenase